MESGVIKYHSPIITNRKMVFIIKRVLFEDIKSLVCEITDKFDAFTDEFQDISVIAKYDEAKEIIKGLICIGYDIMSLDISEGIIDGYYDEYIISISKESKTPTVWCEKFKNKNKYLDEKSSITYVLDNCCAQCLEKIASPTQYETTVGTDDECTRDDCNFAELSIGDGEKSHGFVQSWTDENGSYFSRSFYSTDEEMVQSMFREWKL